MSVKTQKIVNAPRIIKDFVFEARDELKKVAWPSRDTTIRYTIIVVIASLVVGAVIGGVDYLFTLFIELFI